MAIHRRADTMTITYRREIDGLRALAVLAVIAFHARIPGLPGGFVGVDMFLVISGYLIGGLILRETAAGRFSLLDFYERRVRRILPALLVMLAVSAVAAWLLLPGDLRRFGASLTATVLMLSNFLFARDSGYFRPDAEALPLLHGWSLAVEEQFYLVLPILLLLARRRGDGAVRAVLGAAAILSFAYAVWATHSSPAMAFYSPAARAWEFLAGALLAAGVVRAPARRGWGDAAALLGLALVAGSMLLLTAAVAFPGLGAVPVVIGTVLLLYGMQADASRVARAFSGRPIVAIGLISYSLYLWHWPMIVFGGYYVLDSRHLAMVRIAMALLAFPVAWLSWRYIETPFRKPRLLLSRRTLFFAAGAASAVLALYGATIYALDGVPQRFDPVVRRFVDHGNMPDYGCTNRPLEYLRTAARCRLGDPTMPVRFVLWGDSHAAVYFPALKASARAHRVSGYAITTFGCPPLFPPPVRDSAFRNAKRANCLDRNAQTLRLLAATRPGAVLLAARWDAYDGRQQVDGAAGAAPEAFRADVTRLKALGIAVYIVLDVPQTSELSADQLAKARLTGATTLIEPRVADHLRRTAAMRGLAFALRRDGLAGIIDPATLLCGPQVCRMVADGYPLYFDSNHLNARGARLVGPAFDPVLRMLAKPPS